MGADRPITARELARLLRVLAGMIEAGTTNDVDLAPPRRRRTPKRAPAATTTEPSDLAKARARAALRRHGVLP